MILRRIQMNRAKSTTKKLSSVEQPKSRRTKLAHNGDFFDDVRNCMYYIIISKICIIHTTKGCDRLTRLGSIPLF